MKIEHMKNIYLLLFVSLLIASCGPTTVIHSDSYQPAPAPPPVVEVSYQSFYDQLSPYGTWVKYPGYGYVWMPNAGPDFRPYATNGNWIYTDAGWTWASNYNWGWAPFHYGRWFFENGYGWIWVPGNEWAPAWVSWRGGGDYYGWAPLGPSISVDMALNNYNPPAYYWNFVPRQYIGNPGWHNYYVNQSRNVTIINNTTIINNYSGTNRARYAYAPGPDPVEVRRVSGNNFTPVQLREANSPGERISGNQYMIYHPRVSNTATNRGDVSGRPSSPAPARYEAFNNVRPSTQYRMNDAAPVNNQTATNPRPATQNTGYNQPNNSNTQPANTRPQNPNYNQPANNQPVNNPRPAAEAPANNQPIRDPRQVGQLPANNQPVNNPRPATPGTGYNQPNNNAQPPSGNPRSQNPANNQPSNNAVPQNRNSDVGTANPNPTANRDLNRARTDHYNQAQTGTRPVPPNTPARTAAANPAQTTGRNAATNPPQTTGRPNTVHNPNNGQPVPRVTGPENKPAHDVQQKPVEPPKTREAENN